MNKKGNHGFLFAFSIVLLFRVSRNWLAQANLNSTTKLILAYKYYIWSVVKMIPSSMSPVRNY